MTTRSLQSVLESGRRIYNEQGLSQAIRSGAFFAYESLLRTYCSLFGPKTKRDNIFEDDWDILLILDACRLDLMRELQSEYSFLDNLDSRWSVGSTSAEWMENTFIDEFEGDIRDTIYITANPFSKSEITASDFAAVDELWRTQWDSNAGTVRPRPVTDRGISRWRQSTDKRIIVHYMQPHYPFIGSPLTTNGLDKENWGDVREENVWKMLRDGELSTEQVWGSYRENLQIVLEDVSLLLESIDADKVAITADHGNGLGEFGVYGHPRGICLPSVREVPWVITSAEEIREYEPTSVGEPSKESSDDTVVDSRLEALGYK